MSDSTVNNAGNADDVKNYIKCSWPSLTIKRLYDARKDEAKKQKRKTVLAHIDRAIIRKREGKKEF